VCFFHVHQGENPTSYGDGIIKPPIPEAPEINPFR